MAELAVLQGEMARALLSGDFGAIEGRMAPGAIGAAEALSVHRNTALGGLVNALRLSHPTVLALVGEDFFDQSARAFAAAAPPSSAWLTGYGEDFAAFLAAYPLASELPYLADVARFDFAVEAVSGAASGRDGAALDLAGAVLTLDSSLRLVELDYPADAIRDALDVDEDRLGAIDMRPSRHALALWRLPDGVALRRLSAISALFLKAALAGGDPDFPEASEDDLAALQAEVLIAPFARLSLKPTD